MEFPALIWSSDENFNIFGKSSANTKVFKLCQRSFPSVGLSNFSSVNCNFIKTSFSGFTDEREKLSLLEKKLVDRWMSLVLSSSLYKKTLMEHFSFFNAGRFVFFSIHTHKAFLLYLISFWLRTNSLVLQVKVIFVFPAWLLLERVFCCLILIWWWSLKAKGRRGDDQNVEYSCCRWYDWTLILYSKNKV